MLKSVTKYSLPRIEAVPKAIFDAALPRVLIAVLLFPPLCSAISRDSFVDAMSRGFGRTSPFVLILIASLVVLLVGALVAWEIYKSDAQERVKTNVSWQRFGDHVVQRDLDAGGVELLKRLVAAGSLEQPDLIFTSPSVYEEALESLLKEVDKKPEFLARLRTLREKMAYDRLPVEVPISSTRQLNTGHLISYYVEGDSVLRKAEIEEVNEDKWLVKLAYGDGHLFSKGDSARLSIVRYGDGEYSFQAKVLETHYTKPSIELEHSRQMKRKQLRNFVRVEVNLPCRASVLKRGEGEEEKNEQGESAAEQGQILEGRLVDISGGGACARFPAPAKKSSIVNINFDLPGSSIKGVKAEILRQSKKNAGSRDMYEHHLKFVDIDTTVQEKIIRYVFEKQRIDAQWR